MLALTLTLTLMLPSLVGPAKLLWPRLAVGGLADWRHGGAWRDEGPGQARVGIGVGLALRHYMARLALRHYIDRSAWLHYIDRSAWLHYIDRTAWLHSINSTRSKST